MTNSNSLDSEVFIPFPVLETPRLTLDELRMSDAERMFEMECDERVLRYLGKSPPTSVDDVRRKLEVNQPKR
jgi:RimJ/RimL family protein N-acetyltransferase